MRRRNPIRLGTRILAIAILGLSLPGGMSAMELAPAGPCAEPDEPSLRIGAGSPESAAEPADSKGGQSRVARSGPAQAIGPARHRFVPTSVGAGLPSGSAMLGPPRTAHVSHPGACGSAGSVCGGQVAPNPQAGVRARPTARNRPRRMPPVVVDPDPGTGCGGALFPCE